MSTTQRSAIVTAGASGIGASIAATFMRNGISAHIVDIDEQAIESFKTDNPSVHCSHADVSSEADVKRVTSKHFELFGGIDTMVNCAGIAGPTGFVEEIDFKDWRACISVNLDSTFMFCSQVIPKMRESKKGNIINISSTAGWHGYPLRAPYAAAKWGVIGLTKSLAMELGPVGIRANAICPGSISGDRMDRVISAEAKSKGIDEQQVRDKYTQSCSMRTFIDAQDIADMALFLSSDSASKVTGQIMNVDGHLENFSGLDD
jgi:NAD(P)-dependent dehydrogenase (short-subunit alcohol dehydrogenase family)